MQLACKGGKPVCEEPWPRWPIPAPGALDRLREVLDSGRWAISGPYRGKLSQERAFAERFAAFNGARHCVPTTSGTASLLLALEAADLGYGCEVIVPGLTWVASASTVLSINAVPVLVDVEPDSLVLSRRTIEAALTPRTRAVVVVHLYSAMAEMDEILALARERNLIVIEDCAQAHGAVYRGRRAGTLGAAGTFSMQHGKVLTSGEGGALVTDDPVLARRAEQLRADGRLYASGEPPIGAMELVEEGNPMGENRCLSEFQAAVLLAQLELLDEQNRHRAAQAERLDAMLARLGAYLPQRTSPGTDRRTHYQYAVAVDGATFEAIPIERIANAISAELGIPIHRTYPPLNRNRLYAPVTRRRFHLSPEHLAQVDPRRFALPECERAHQRFLTFHHPALLAQPAMIDKIAAAFEKVLELRNELREP